MTKGKKPIKEIHVDKLVVKAKEVIIIDESKRPDPWLFHRKYKVEEMEAAEEVEVEEEIDEDEEKRPFSWI